MLKGKKAIVTGGTRGIGLAIVSKFLENGADVAVCGSRKETAERAVEQLKIKFPDRKILALYPDLSDPASVEEAFDFACKELGGLDVLVNNAGLSARASLFDYDYAEFEKVVNLNLNAVFVCAQAAAKRMKETGGCIINTSSMVSKYGQPAGVAYPASKFAVNGLTLSLARELGPYNIRVNAVAPGVTNTDMVAVLPKEVIAPIVAQIPLRRVGEPEDVANAFLFLASDMASYITGAVLPVDGAARS
ncbi:MAG: 3-oxoacyl-ACP reductase FabG [Clostridia bacterium]|nr:3-oxoacyl-ACP reductase FabG [Clostridia bacterium]